MEKKIIRDGLEYRAYFLVPYNISPIQQGIQAGHALGRFLLKYGRYNPDHVAWEFLENHETWIVLNGGTTNDYRELGTGLPLGTLNQDLDAICNNEIEHSYFIEPDLNRALSAVCIIVDERVFNYEDYPDFMNYIVDMKMYKHAKDAMPAENLKFLMDIGIEKSQEMFPEYYKEWVHFMGGEKNMFLRQLLRYKKKA